MEKKNLRQELIDAILIKNDGEDNESERQFLEQLSITELQALAGADPEIEGADED